MLKDLLNENIISVNIYNRNMCLIYSGAAALLGPIARSMRVKRHRIDGSLLIAVLEYTSGYACDEDIPF